MGPNLFKSAERMKLLRNLEASSLPSKYQVTCDLVKATNCFWLRNLKRCKLLNILECSKSFYFTIIRCIKFEAKILSSFILKFSHTICDVN
eukprot:UN01686